MAKKHEAEPRITCSHAKNHTIKLNKTQTKHGATPQNANSSADVQAPHDRDIEKQERQRQIGRQTGWQTQRNVPNPMDRKPVAGGSENNRA